MGNLLKKFSVFGVNKKGNLPFYFFIVGNNKHMQTALILILVFFIVVLVLFFPFSLTGLIYSNILENANFVCVRFLVFFTICKKINFQNRKIILTSTNGKKKEFELKPFPPFLNNFFINILKNVGVDYFDVFIRVGSGDDAAKSAYMTGFVLAIISQINVFLNLKKNVIINKEISTNYNEDKLAIALNLKISITIFAVIVSLFKAFGSVILGGTNGKKRKSN